MSLRSKISSPVLDGVRARTLLKRRHAINVSSETYQAIKEIAERVDMPLGMIVDFLILEHGRLLTHEGILAKVAPSRRGRPKQSVHGHRSYEG